MTTDHIADLQRTYALVVGIEKYALGPGADLDGPAHDALRFADWLSTRGVPRENIVLLLSPLDGSSALLDQWPGPYKWPATRERVDHAINQMVSHWMGDLLYIFWGGHGVMTATRSRRLFYADTTAADWHHLVLDSLLIHLGSHYLSGFQQEICMVDACANYQRRFSQEQLGDGDTFLPGEPIAGREQFVLLATREGEVAKNLSQEQTGYFSKVVLEELAKEPNTLWPPNMEGVAERVKNRFEALRREGVIRQTPISIQYQTWEGTTRSLIEMSKQAEMEALHRWVFIAASPLDQAFVLRLRSDLEAQGIALWSQNTAIQNAPDQEEALHQAIRMASVVLLIASPDACHSRTVKESLRLAITYQQQVIVMWARGSAWETSIPEGWSKREYIDARETSYEMALQEVITRLRRYTSVSSAVTSLMGELETDVEPRNPYKGLRAFRGEDARDFFGRDALVEELVEALRESLAAEQQSKAGSRLLAVVGPSGSGKSSVVMAGLIPSLQSGALVRSQEWIYLEPMKPGSHPLEAMTLTLSHQLAERTLISLREDLEADSARGLHLLAGHIAKQSGVHVVLFVDQFEELFVQTIAEEERQQFIDLLVAAITEPQGPLIVLLTMRADFYDRPIHYSELARLIKECQHLVIPMELQDLRAVIEQPAMLPEVQLIFEDTLVGDLLFEVQGQLGALPLLQFTLEQLFELRSGHWLTLQAYSEIGGVKGALAKQAEATYTSLPSEEHRKLARALFLRLIDPGLTEQDTTRRRASVTELSLPGPEQTTIMREVADAFVTARLLTTNETAGTTTIEVSHEALIREWPRLAEWLHKAREDIVLQQTISEDATNWVGHRKPVDRLYRGAQLVEGQAWAERNMPNTDEVAFLQAGVAERQHQEGAALNQKVRELNLQRKVVDRQRILIAALSLFSVIVIVLASVAGFSFLQEQAQQKRAEMEAQIAHAEELIASSRALAADASFALSQHKLDLALLLSVKAYRTANTYEARNSLLSALEDSPQIDTMLRSGLTLSVFNLAFSSDGRTLVSSDGNNIYIWDIQKRDSPIRQFGNPDYIGGVALSPDNRTLATSSAGGVWLWNMLTGAAPIQLDGSEETLPTGDQPPTPLAFSSDGRFVASARCRNYPPNQANPVCVETKISRWNVLSKPPTKTSYLIPADADHSTFSPDGQILASIGNTGVQLWNVATGQPLGNLSIGSSNSITSLALSPDDMTLALGSMDGNVQLWNVGPGQTFGSQVVLIGHSGSITSLAFSPKSNILASSSQDGTVRLWNVTTGRLKTTLSGAAQKKWSVAFSSDGGTLASGSNDGTILLWNVDAESTISQQFPIAALLRSPVYSPDGTVVFAGSDDGKIWRQNAMTGQTIDMLDTNRPGYPPLSPKGLGRDNPLSIESLALSQDGGILASGRLDGTIILWDTKAGMPLTKFIYPDLLYKVMLSSNGQILAAGGNGDKIMLWDVAKGTLLKSIPYQSLDQTRALPVALSPDGKLLAVGGCGKMTNGSCVKGEVQLWDVAIGKPISQPLLGHSFPVSAVAFGPDETTLASSSRDGIILWNVKTRQANVQMLSLPADKSNYYSNILFSPDGKMLASYGTTSLFSFVLWDVTQQQPLADAIHEDGFNQGSVAFSPNGQQLASVSVVAGSRNNGLFTLWNINIDSWQGLACSIANRNLIAGEWQQFVSGEMYKKVNVCSHSTT